MTMLKNIKSTYFSKLILSFINEKQKLLLIKYNKSIQKAININLTNFKLISGKYISYESNGKIKEYYLCDNNLAYEGEYSNGKRNGKGKEYNWNGKLMFDGEYKNGKRNGKGKEYSGGLGILIFEGDFLNGKRNGKGKEYNGIDKLIFDGEYKNGKRNGEGKEYNNNGILVFEGKYLNNERVSGIQYDTNGNKINDFKILMEKEKSMIMMEILYMKVNF